MKKFAGSLKLYLAQYREDARQINIFLRHRQQRLGK